MQLDSTEVNGPTKQRIVQSNTVSGAHSEGIIVSVSDGVIHVHGLANCM